MFGYSEEYQHGHQNKSSAYDIERKCRTKLTAAAVSTKQAGRALNDKGLLSRQIKLINDICGAGEDKTKEGPAKVTSQIEKQPRATFEQIYQEYSIKDVKGPAWLTYRRPDLLNNAGKIDVTLTLTSPPEPYKTPNKFHVTAEIFRLCERLKAADFKTKNEEIDDICDLFQKMTIKAKENHQPFFNVAF